MSGLESLAYGLGVMIVLMATIFVLSRILMLYGILPLSAAFSFSGFNLLLFYLLILPGTIVHEMSHYLACLLTGVRVRQVRLFSPQENGAVGWVVHERVDPVRRNVIALAPFLGGAVVIYLLVRFVLLSGQTDPLILASDDMAQGLRATVASVLDVLRSADLRQVKTWLVFYVLFSLGFAVAPSKQDLGHFVADGALALGLVLVIKVTDSYYELGLARSGLVNDVAAWFPWP